MRDTKANASSRPSGPDGPATDAPRRGSEEPPRFFPDSDDGNFPEFIFEEDPLGLSEEEYWTAFRQWPLACLVFDLDSLRIVCATDLVAEAFGFAGREMENYDLSHAWPESEFVERFEFIKRTRDLESGDSGSPVPLRRHDGSLFWSRFTWRNVQHRGRSLRVVFFPDLQASDGDV